MNWRVCRVSGGNRSAVVASVAFVLTGLICPPGAGFGETRTGQRHDVDPNPKILFGSTAAPAGPVAAFPSRNYLRLGGIGVNAAGVDEETRLASRLRAPVAPNDEDRKGKPGYLRRAKIFLAAGDYRRALDACLFHLWDQPSVESYVYLTYVYHAIDGYMEHLASQDRWVAVEHLFLNLAARGADDVIDPPDVLARMAKEIMHGALQKQADVTSAMAGRLDREAVNRLWREQSAWRTARPDDWWAGVPDAWAW